MGSLRVTYPSKQQLDTYGQAVVVVFVIYWVVVRRVCVVVSRLRIGALGTHLLLGWIVVKYSVVRETNIKVKYIFSLGKICLIGQYSMRFISSYEGNRCSTIRTCFIVFVCYFKKCEVVVMQFSLEQI